MTYRQSNNGKKNLISKSESVTIRVSKEIKEQLRILSKKNNKNASQFIRQLIENRLDHFHNKSKQELSMNHPYADQRTKTTVNNWLGHEKPISKLIFAVSLILTIDTEIKTTDIIKLLQDFTNKSEIGINASENRIMWENYYLDLRRLIVSHISPSQTALVVIDTMVLSFLSVIFPSPVFMASKLSMLMINTYDMLLPQNMRDHGKSI